MVQEQKLPRWNSSVRGKRGVKEHDKIGFFLPYHGPAAQTPNKGEGLKNQQLDYEGQHCTWPAILHCSKIDDIKTKKCLN